MASKLNQEIARKRAIMEEEKNMKFDTSLRKGGMVVTQSIKGKVNQGRTIGGNLWDRAFLYKAKGDKHRAMSEKMIAKLGLN